MNRRARSFLRWLPAIMAAAVMVTVGFWYRTELTDWFRPLVQPAADSSGAADPEGSASNTMKGSMTKGRQNTPQPPSQTVAGPFNVSVDWTPSPPRVGENTVTVKVADTSGLPIEGASVHLKVDDLVEIPEHSAGLYRSDVNLPDEGDWELLGDIRTGDLRHADFAIELTTGASPISVTAMAGAHEAGADGEIAYWSCSMHPSVKSEGSGTCPICAMDLTPVTREEVDTGVIVVDARRRQLIGVKTGTVRRESVAKTIRTVGMILPNETRVQDVSLKFKAWIGEVDADFTGKSVQKGERLFTFYSPDLWSAQQEYIDAARRSGENPGRTNRLVESAETRLRLWGIDGATIASIREKGRPADFLPFMSPVSGTIMEKSVYEGSAVEAGERLYRVADLSTLWVEAEIYENELSLVELGQTADISLAYRPDSEFAGIVSYIYPYLNEETRTVRIRIEVPNHDGALKPSMYANVHLRIPLGERLVVPESAIIYAGETRVAFVDLGEGRLQPRKVKTGVREDDWIEIRDGLSEGETVVTSANFLIAAESKLKSGIDKW